MSSNRVGRGFGTEKSSTQNLEDDMKKFLKLLDPYERPAFFDSEAAVRYIDEEQQRAREQFPLMVAQSNLHYWRPGDPISTQGIRFLLALGAGFSLKDLRFADVFNEALSKH